MSGIRAAIAESLPKIGANIALLGLTAESRGGPKDACEKAGVKAMAYSCDLADFESVRKIFDQIETDLEPIE